MREHEMTSQPVYLQTPAAAARVNLAPSTMEKLRITGGGPKFIRLTPKKIVYAASSLDDWAREREFRSTKEYGAAAA
jgi:hypothetical protein